MQFFSCCSTFQTKVFLIELDPKIQLFFEILNFVGFHTTKGSFTHVINERVQATHKVVKTPVVARANPIACDKQNHHREA